MVLSGTDYAGRQSLGLRRTMAATSSPLSATLVINRFPNVGMLLVGKHNIVPYLECYRLFAGALKGHSAARQWKAIAPVTSIPSRQ